MDDYALCSFIRRDGNLIAYGENSPLLGYSYFYETLQNWMIEKLNEQKEQGPLEDLHRLIVQADYPQQMLISIGATRYTAFGEKHYLQRGDILYVVAYPQTDYSYADIEAMCEAEKMAKGISLLRQVVV